MINQSSLHRRARTIVVWAVCVFLVAADSIGVISAMAATRRRIQAGKSQVVPISVSAKGRGIPWVDFQDAVPTSVDYVGQEAYVKAVAGGQARPLSIAVGDLNNDGTPDVVSGYASGSTGLLMVQKGTPTGLDRQGVIFPIQKAPYLLQVGEFTGDGNADVVAATSGEASLQVMRGDGFGGFAQPETVELSGTIISLTSTKNHSSSSTTLVVGLAGEKTSSLLVYSGGLKATPHTVSLPLDEPTHLAMSMPDQQGAFLGAATGETLMLVRGFGAKAPKIKRTFDYPVQGLVFGHFTQAEKTEVAVLVSNGDVFVFSVDALFADATTEGVLFGRIPNPKGLAGLSVGHFAKDAAGLDDLLVMDRGTRKVYVLVANDLLNREDRTVTAEFDVSTRLVAVAPIQMTAGQPQELVVLSLGPNVSLVSQTKKAEVGVTHPGDSADSSLFAPTEKRPDLEVNPLYSPGKDGALTVTTAGQIVNRYTFLTANAAAGATTITVDNTNATNRLVPMTHLTAGDLILIIQMQGATITTTNNSAYGTVTALNNAGKFEFFSVSSVTSTTISLANCTGGLRNSYTSAGRVQVIKVPQYTNLTVNSPGYITAPAWDGSLGGIVAVHVQNTAALNNAGANGSIDVSGLGFRGGVLDNNTNGADTGSTATLFRSSSSNDGAEKGEGIAGNQVDYDGLNGRYGRGAPANGGGGGNTHNAGGGGGSNGNNGVAYDGLGNPSTSTASWATAWNLEGGGFSTHTSSGGGRGGYSYSASNQDALTVAPGNSSWGGDGRDNTGGWGGRPLDNDPSTTASRIFMGGGGGAGDANNGSAGGPAGKGGGIVFLLAATVSGSGTILANGAAGGNTTPSHNDAPGGGGGGGSVVVKATSLANTITINANGGAGGNQLITNNEAEGPGGGGGGGYIATAGGTPTQNVNGGANGTTSSGAVTEFIPNGATRGAAGNTATAPADASFPFCFPTGTITGHVFTDTNGDGIQNGGEPDLAGVSVTITPATGSPITVTTNASGNYTASGVAAGSATVNVADPANTIETTNVDPQTVTVTGNTTTTATTVGFQPVGTVTGHVFNDVNGNGTQDSGEPNLVGVDVVIDSVNGAPVTVQTDANGDYSAPNIAAGSTTVNVTDPSGFILTTANDPQTVTVTQGGTADATDVGFQGQGTVTGHVFNDLNGNGVQDSGEPDLSGVNVTLTPAGGGTPITVTTDGNGNYTATNVPAGNVDVNVTDPANSNETTNIDPQTVNVAAGGTATTAPVGFQFVGSVSGHVFEDVNGNGTQDSGEPNLSGVNVTLTPANGTPVTVATDGNGNYTAPNIPAGSVSVNVDDPAGTVETTNTDPQTVSVTAGNTTATNPVGYQGQGTVTGHVFTDTNGNGIQDSGEPDLSGVSVTLTPANGSPVTVTTDGNGNYSAPNIPAGNVGVDVADPAGNIETTNVDPQTVSVTAGGTTTANTVGYQPVGTVTGHVFNDVNGNGVQDSGEPNLVGVDVVIDSVNGAPVTVQTDANGNYTAPNIPAGNASVDVADPANANETTNVDPQTVSVTAGNTTTPAPVGYQFVGVVTGHVFTDTNGNGTQDSGEPNLSNVNVTLTPANGAPVTVQTDANGNYTASNIPAGSVSVDVADPAGTVETTNTDPQTVTVTTGNTSTANPVGYQGQGTVTGHVFTDTNGNGTQDSGEPNLVGVNVTLTPANGAPVTVQTDANGNYTANGVPAGSVSVDVADPAGTIESTNVDPQSVTVTAGNSTTASTVGFQPVGTVTGHVFNDVNGNGIQDSGEPNLVGVNVTLTPANGSPVTVQTDANGNYTASNVPAGSVGVDVADPAGTVETTNTDPQTVTVTAGNTTTPNPVGYQGQGTVTGHVFTDSNGNGVQDSGEPNLANVNVTLTPANGAPVTVQTDANGNYTASNIPAGNVGVDVADPVGNIETTNVDPQTVSVTGGNTTTASTVGYQPVGTVSGHVFQDTNGNGVQDSGEPNLAGVDVVIDSVNGAPVTVQTDANGNYTASNIPAGSTTIEVADPANTVETTNTDPQTVTVNAGKTTTANPVGYQGQGTVTGHVFTDTNGNGIQDSGEPNLVGVDVTITPANGSPVTVQTDANGNYSVPNVPAGSVTVEVTDPANTTETTNTDPQTVTLALGGTATTNPVGYQPFGTVSGHVFTDTNGNGVQDSGEPNLVGVDVVIDSDNGAPVTVTTDANGNYTANNIPAGNTTVNVADPANTLETTNTDPQSVTVTQGGTATPNPVGYQPVGTITGHVFNDVDGDGIQDPGEPNLVGVDVVITPANGTPITVQTDANGNYTVPNVPAGSVTVNVTDPAGMVQTTGNDPQTVTVTAGATTTPSPVGFQGQGTVMGHVFQDTNGNGVQDSGEPNLGGVNVTLTPAGGGAPITVQTDANGNYTANGVPSGQVTVNVADPAGNLETTNTDPQTVTLAAGGSTTANPVGYQPVGTINGHVFNDVDGDGVQDPGEPDLIGVMVTVTPASTGVPITVQTDANGNYTIPNVPAGSVTVDVTDPTGMVETTNTDPQPVTVTPGGTTTPAPVGFQGQGIVTGHVFTDTNGNGVQDSGEPNLVGVNVTLTPAGGGTPITVQTDANGNYTANSVPAGQVTVEVADPAGNFETTNTDPQTINLTAGTTATANPVGYQPLGGVTGHVFSDVNGNGVQDSGEPNLVGVTVTITPTATGTPITLTTDSNGNYTSSTVPAGSATINVTDPVGNALTTANDPQTVTIPPGSNATPTPVGFQPQTDLAVQKTVNDPTPAQGEQVTFTITVTNNGLLQATNVRLTDALPSGLQYVSHSPANANYNSSNGLWTIGTINFPGSATLQITALVTGTGSITNTTSGLTADQADPNSSNNTGSVSLNSTPEANLMVIKQATTENATAGQNLVYTIQAVNNGPSPAASVVVTDVLPANTTFVSLSVPSGWTPNTPSVGGTGTVTMSKPTMAAAETATFTLTVLVNPAATTGTNITNSASIASPTTDPNPNDNTSSPVVTPVGAQADVWIQKTASTNQITAGQQMTYTLNAGNYGPSTAVNTVISDPLPAGTTYVSSTAPAGWTVTAPAVGTNGTVTFTHAAVPTGATATFTITVKVDQTLQPGTPITNVAGIQSSIPEPAGGTENNAGSAGMTVNASCYELNVLYAADTFNHRIQKFDGVRWTIIGKGTAGSGLGQFRAPEAVTASRDGQRIYVADTENNRIQWSTNGGTTWAVFAGVGASLNQVREPRAVVVDIDGNLYVADNGNDRVLRFTGGIPGPAVVLATLGPTGGRVQDPRGLAIDCYYNLYIADNENSRILKLLNANTVTQPNLAEQIAGVGAGTSPIGQVRQPEGIAVDGFNNLYIADTANNRIIMFPTQGPQGVNPGESPAILVANAGAIPGNVRYLEGITITSFTQGPMAGSSSLIIGDSLNSRIQGRMLNGTTWTVLGDIGTSIGKFRNPSKLR